MKESIAAASEKVREYLNSAIKYHQNNNFELAIKFYEKSLNIEETTIAYQNAASLMRKEKKYREAEIWVTKGLQKFPHDSNLWNIQGNILRDKEDFQGAIASYLQSLRIDSAITEARLSIAIELRRLGLTNLAYGQLKNGLIYSNDPRLIYQLLEILSDSSFEIETESSLGGILEIAESLDESEIDKTPDMAMILAQLYVRKKDAEKCTKWYAEASKRIESKINISKEVLKTKFKRRWHQYSWNLSIYLLKNGQFKEGWKLYDHGLQVEAEGPQRWQRSLTKPFSSNQVKLWRGENLKDKHLLLLSEQGIGDTMMFATLIPELLKEGCQITFLSGERLEPIYARSYPDINTIKCIQMLHENKGCHQFDYQSPIGSIMQYRFTDINSYGNKPQAIAADEKTKLHYINKYNSNKPLVGISWQGGGKKKRIEQKSIPLKALLPILKTNDYQFVSLQYGNDGDFIKRFNHEHGTSIIDDPEVDAIKNIDNWLSQVAAMDLVISIANTTIHGAGGLGKPTLCLLSKDSDWRWLNPDVGTECYWYKSVKVAQQEAGGSWENALSITDKWVKSCI